MLEEFIPTARNSLSYDKIRKLTGRKINKNKYLYETRKITNDIF